MVHLSATGQETLHRHGQGAERKMLVLCVYIYVQDDIDHRSCR